MPYFVPYLEKRCKKNLKYHQPVKLHHFVQKMKKNTLKDGLDAKKDAKRDAKSSFCCSAANKENEEENFEKFSKCQNYQKTNEDRVDALEDKGRSS